jgi:hypothetical protein
VFESNNLKFEGKDFLPSCLALMEQFAVSGEDLVLKLESKMFELSKGNQDFTVSLRHIDAVRHQLEKERKQQLQGQRPVSQLGVEEHIRTFMAMM